MPLTHLLGIAQLTKEELVSYIENANRMVEISTRDIKKVPALRGKTVVNLFSEPSTRTRSSFEIAAKRLSADAINISDSGSSSKKGETLLDTARTLESMSPDILVIRHKESGAAHFLAKYLHNTSVVNAGDGTHEHPTQALLDCLTLHRKFDGKIEGLNVAIVGDILHSRVARSNIWAHLLLGNKITLVAPPTLIPNEVRNEKCFGEKVSITHSLKDGIAGADVVMCLRMQTERQGHFFIPSMDEYSQQYCVTEKLLKQYAPKSVVLHPGPMNRGIEISSEVADGPRSLIREQVANGVAVRMAVLYMLAKSSGPLAAQEKL